MAKLYYTAPSDEAFEDMRAQCIALWETKGNEGGYRDEKIARIRHIHNVADNFMYMFAMLDIYNQRWVADRLSEETKQEVFIRMVDGGNDRSIIYQSLGI